MYWCIEYCCNSSIIPLFQKAYRDWLCTQHIPVFSRNSPPSRIPPCGDFCSGVEHKCPFLRPLTETTYAGEPSFICKGKSCHAVTKYSNHSTQYSTQIYKTKVHDFELKTQTWGWVLPWVKLATAGPESTGRLQTQVTQVHLAVPYCGHLHLKFGLFG